MFTGTPEELRKLQQEARKLAEQTAELLNQIDALGLDPGSGHVRTPGGIIRNRPGQGWTVTDR